jgi:hypothetical protein
MTKTHPNRATVQAAKNHAWEESSQAKCFSVITKNNPDINDIPATPMIWARAALFGVSVVISCGHFVPTTALTFFPSD